LVISTSINFQSYNEKNRHAIIVWQRHRRDLTYPSTTTNSNLLQPAPDYNQSSKPATLPRRLASLCLHAHSISPRIQLHSHLLDRKTHLSCIHSSLGCSYQLCHRLISSSSERFLRIIVSTLSRPPNTSLGSTISLPQIISDYGSNICQNWNRSKCSVKETTSDDCMHHHICNTCFEEDPKASQYPQHRVPGHQSDFLRLNHESRTIR
jgi:hypothetical protein